jgi:hypothetical protein
MKQILRAKIKHPYGKKRYRIESLFGNIKNKANSVFKVKRWAILWNFYMILIYVFLFILSVLIFRRNFFDFWNSLKSTRHSAAGEESHVFSFQVKKSKR